jgi:hypothetical protein
LARHAIEAIAPRLSCFAALAALAGLAAQPLRADRTGGAVHPIAAGLAALAFDGFASRSGRALLSWRSCGSWSAVATVAPRLAEFATLAALAGWTLRPD